MKKVIFISLICVIFFITGCFSEEKAGIFLGREPIDPKTFSFENKQPVFKQRERIYYILLSKDPIENPKLRLQVIKLDMKHPYYKIEPAYGIDINRGVEKHYLTDYFVLNQAGTYIIRIFSYDDLEEPLAQTEFVVKAL